MADVTFTGTLRTRLLNDVRQFPEFRIRRSRQRVELLALYSDPETRLAWIECARGTWRLPAALFTWAETVEEQARALTGNDEVFPCWSEWDHNEATGVFTVEIFPDGYTSPF
ncbi:hypothetical protein ACFRMO_08065 [Streptomyces anulatus]|uniref:hypothetical protein n=1 Tax=Streptomyces anulatus TaxID=1892 RepID=UPI0036BEA46A